MIRHHNKIVSNRVAKVKKLLIQAEREMWNVPDILAEAEVDSDQYDSEWLLTMQGLAHACAETITAATEGVDHMNLATRKAIVDDWKGGIKFNYAAMANLRDKLKKIADMYRKV